MRRVFADSSYYVALANRNDAHHDRAVEWSRANRARLPRAPGPRLAMLTFPAESFHPTRLRHRVLRFVIGTDWFCIATAARVILESDSGDTLPPMSRIRLRQPRAPMRYAALTVSLAVLTLLWPSTPVRADLVLHRQAPSRGFGISSDTEYANDFGNPTSALTADRFSLAQPTSAACRIVFWSFYGTSFAPTDPDPPLTETIRVRLYSESAGLPGEVLDEASFADPPRVFTGFLVNEFPRRKEYKYQVDLPTCWNLTANTNYWIEVAQVGDLDSVFRWENASGGEFANQFPIGAPWRISTLVASMAYEIRTPEPGSGALLVFGVGFLLKRRRR